MSNYTKTTDFEAKDSLPTGDSGKIIRGAEFETEFDAISTAIATKADTAGPTFTGTLTFETISDGTIGVTAFVDEDNMASNSATLVPTQQSVKAYVDSVTTELNAQDLDFQADSGGALNIDLDTETMTFTGGTGIDTSGSGNTVTFDIDSTVTTLTGTQTLTNKTLTAPVISGNLTTDGTIDGRDVATDGAKLDGIEAGATADQTDAEIRAAVEAATDSNVFTDADHTKLDGIEASATADQTDAEIRAAVEAATDSNVFTDADHTKLDGIEASATADQTDAEIRAAVEAATDSNVFTDADHTKLDGIEALADVTDTTNVTAAGALMDSELTNLTAVKSLDQGVATTDSPTFAGLTTTADVSFGDNDKAIFGAGSDLQIYHDGSNSFIADVGTGNLGIRAENLFLQNADGSANYATASLNGAFTLSYNNSIKLATTNTGIDVTGTVTADGLTVANTAVIAGDFDGGTAATYIRLQDDTDNFLFGSNNSLGNFLIKNETADALRLSVANTGDISFYEDTGTTAKLFWDASAESLGIGTSSPEEALHVSGSFGDAITSKFENTGSALSYIEFENSAASGALIGARGQRLSFLPNGTETMVIDSSGNVGINQTPSATSSYMVALQVGEQANLYGHTDGTGAGSATYLSNNITHNGAFKYINADLGSQYTQASGGHIFSTFASGSAGATATEVIAVKIDASGNLLVGKTSADDFGSAGAQIEAGGQITNSVASAPSLRLNRGGTDGDVIEINKAGQPVGSIGSSNSGYNLFITTSDTGLAFNYLADEIVPCTANGAYRNAAIDLGDANAQFKDLYLSGGAYLGGTAAANKLDDYEEGTWTPTIFNATVTYTAQRGRYTKIGRVVYIHCFIQIASISGANSTNIVTGLPFTSKNDGNYPALASKTNGFDYGGSSTMCTFQVVPNTTHIAGVGSGNNQSFRDLNSSGLSATDWIAFTGHYVTDS